MAEVRETVSVNKQREHKFHMERFNLKTLIMVWGTENYHLEVSKMFAALKDLVAEVVVVYETIRQNKTKSAQTLWVIMN
jgi:hypothetical protein